jgi:hypothetical protein
MLDADSSCAVAFFAVDDFLIGFVTLTSRRRFSAGVAHLPGAITREMRLDYARSHFVSFLIQKGSAFPLTP